MLDLQLVAVTLDCEDVERVAAFWSELLGLPLRESLPGWRRLGPVPGGPSLTFQPVGARSSTGSAAHIDFTTAAGATAVARVLELGGELLDEHRYHAGVVRVVADPEGHPFCLVEYRKGHRPA